MYKLVIVHKGRIQKNIPLHQDSMLIGRKKASDICLEEKLVSSRHAMINIHQDKVMLNDLGSTNGTRVNGNNIKEIQLQTGDQISIGHYKLIFVTEHSDEDDPDATMIISPSTPNTSSTQNSATTGYKKPITFSILKGVLLIITLIIFGFFIITIL